MGLQNVSQGHLSCSYLLNEKSCVSTYISPQCHLRVKILFPYHRLNNSACTGRSVEIGKRSPNLLDDGALTELHCIITASGMQQFTQLLYIHFAGETELVVPYSLTLTPAFRTLHGTKLEVSMELCTRIADWFCCSQTHHNTLLAISIFCPSTSLSFMVLIFLLYIVYPAKSLIIQISYLYFLFSL